MDDYDRWCQTRESVNPTARQIWDGAIKAAVTKLREQGRILAAHSVEQLLSQGREVENVQRGSTNS